MKELKNTLLKRREVELVIHSEANPGFEVAKKAVADKLKSDENLVVVRAVRGKFGSKDFLIEAFVYDNEEAKKKVEPVKKEKKEARA